MTKITRMMKMQHTPHSAEFYHIRTNDFFYRKKYRASELWKWTL